MKSGSVGVEKCSFFFLPNTKHTIVVCDLRGFVVVVCLFCFDLFLLF